MCEFFKNILYGCCGLLCGIDVSAVELDRYIAPQEGSVLVYEFTPQPGPVVDVEVKDVRQGYARFEEIITLPGDSNKKLSNLYEIYTDGADLIKKNSNGVKEVIIKGPIKVGQLWNVSSTIMKEPESSVTKSKCSVVEIIAKEILGTERNAIKVKCLADHSDLISGTTYIYAENVGLVEKIIETKNKEGVIFGALTQKLIDLK